MAEVSSARAIGQEFLFTATDFARLRSMIYQRAGISLSDQKQEMAYGRLARRLRVLGYADFSAYLDDLERHPDSEEWVNFTNALTTNLTSFFREAHHFSMLEDYLRSIRPPVRIWCAASSTGEEAYSIAMTACEVWDSLLPPVDIVASDIDTNVLATAGRGVYAAERVNRLSPQRIRRFFLKGSGKNDGLVRVRPELRSMISFEQINLLDHRWPDHGPYDAIFCRNVMIYFDKPTQAGILARFASVMKPGGWLFAGHSENFINISSDFTLLGKTVYVLQESVNRMRMDTRGMR